MVTSSHEGRRSGSVQGRFTFGRLTRIAAFFVVALLAFSLPAAAQDADAPTLGGLLAAMTARVNAINALGSPSKPQKKEAKLFGKAQKQFNRYLGVNDKKDFKTLGKVAGIVSKSKTQDASVLDQVEAILTTIDDVGIAARQVAEETRGFLSDVKALAALDKLLGKGDALRLKGLELWEVDFAKGAKQVAASIPHFQKAAALAVKQKVIDADVILNDARPTGVTLLTRAPAEINHPIRVQADYEIDQPSPLLTVSLFANSVRTKSDGNGGLVPSTQWEVGSQTLVDVPAGAGSVVFENQIPLWMFRQDLQRQPTDTAEASYGRIVAADGDTVAVAGARTGGKRIHLYQRDAGGADEWGEAKVLDVPEVYSLALSGDTLAFGTTVGGARRVAVHGRNTGGVGAWGKDTDLAPSDTTADIAFGNAVDVSGNWIVVGAPTADPFGIQNAGAAYLYERDFGGAGAWGQKQQLTDAGGSQPNGLFGTGIGMDGDLMAIGAPNHSSAVPNSGEAYSYELNAASGFWSVKFSLNGVLHSQGSKFGGSIAVDGDTIVVAAVLDSPFGISQAGSAQVFQRPAPGLLIQGPLLTSHNPKPGDLFGYGVAVSGDVIAASAYLAFNGDGTTFLFVRDQEGPGAWGQLERLRPPPGSGGFGRAVSAHDDVIVVGGTDPDGYAMIFPGMDPIIEGDYVFTVQVDPPMTADLADQGLIFERPLPVAESNNIFPGDGAPETVMFDGGLINMPNVTLESVVVTPDQIFVDTGSANLASFGATVKISMAGDFDGPISGARLHIGMGILNSQCVGVGAPDVTEVLIWDEALEMYVPGLPFVSNGSNVPHEFAGIPLPDLVSGETLTIHANLAFNILYDDMSCVYDVEVPVIVWVPPFVTEVDPENPGNPTADNFILLPHISCNVVSKPKCSFSQGYEKRMGNEWFGASAGFRASLDMVKSIPGLDLGSEGAKSHKIYPGSEAEHGVVAGAEGGVSVDLFGFDVDLVRTRTLVERDPVDNYGFVASELVFFDPFTLQEQVVYSVGPFDTIDLEAITKFPEGVAYDSVKGEISIEKTVDVGKKYDSDQITKTDKDGKKTKVTKPPTPKLFFGPIPVFVKATAEGSVGFTVKLRVGNAFVAEAFPFAKIQAGVEVDVGGIGVAGAEGKLILIEEQFRLAGGLGLNVFDHPKAPATPVSKGMSAGLCFRVANEINILNGEISVFARYPSITWCDGGTFFPDYPCGFRIRKWTKKLVEFTAHKDCRILVNKTEPLCCETISGLPIPSNICDVAPSGVCASDVCDG